MKNRLRLFVVVLMLLSGSVYSQDLFRLMNDPNANFFYVQKVAEKYFKEKGTGKGSGYKQYKRWEYEMYQKIDVNGNRIDPSVFRNEYLTFQKKYAQRKGKVLAGSTTTGNWKELGPVDWNQTTAWSPGVGRVTSVVVDPNNSNTIYITSPGGGCWKSTNGGTSWVSLTDNEAFMEAYSFAVTPGNSNIVYLGTASGGVLKSTNGGTSWTVSASGIPSYARVSKLLIHPTNVNMIFAATAAGVYKSTNAGSSWTLTASYYVEDIEFKPGDPSVVYASGSAFLRSANTGDSFTQITNGLSTLDRTMIGVSPANPSVVYLVQASGSLFGYLFKSTDSGLSFTTKVTGNPSNGTNYFGYTPDGRDTRGQAGYDMAICVSPVNADEVYIGGINVWKSTNGGTSFNPSTDWTYPNVHGYVHADIHALEFYGSTLYSGSDGGIYRSTNNGEDWTDLSNGLGIKQFYRLGCSATNRDVISAGAQDNGTCLNTSSGWIDWIGADGMETFVDHTDSKILYGTSQHGYLYKSINGGMSFSSISRPTAPDGNWVTPWVMDPVNHNKLYLGLNKLYVSNDAGATWFTFPNYPGNGNLDNIAVAPSNTNYIYAQISGVIYRTKDGGNTWATLSPGGSIRYISVSPSNPEKIYITSSNGERVRVSTNAGDTFTDISGTLPNISANCVVVDNTPQEGIYVALNVGVYYRNNTMSDWIPFMDNLPKVVVNELEIVPSMGLIRAATYGRGVWESPVYNSSFPEVSITPGQNSVFNLGSNVLITATATDADGSITKVEFYNGTTKLGEDNTSPYEYTLSSIANTQYEIWAKAIDNNGNASQSSASSIYGMRNPENPSGTNPGVLYSYYEGDWSQLPDFALLTPVETGVVTTFNLSQRNRDELFAFQYEGYVNAPADGIYKFSTSSDDGSQLFIGNTLVVNNDGVHGEDTRLGFIALKAGKHAIKVTFFENSGGEALTVRWAANGAEFQEIPASALFRVGGGNTPPQVSITSPANNATVISNVIITADATDSDGTITKVEFYNGTNKLGEDLTYPYSYTWSGVAVGTYSLTAKAFDNSGGSSVSAAITVNVSSGCTDPEWSASQTYSTGSKVTYNNRKYTANYWNQNQRPDLNCCTAGEEWTDNGPCGPNNVAPYVSITSPSNNASFSSGSNLTINADATDSDGTIAKVEFYYGATKLGEDDVYPYSFTWNAIPYGNFALTAKATDNLGAETTSSAINIIVHRAPEIVVVSPADNSTVNLAAGASAFIDVEVNDEVVVIDSVKYIVVDTYASSANVRRYTTTSAPFDLTFMPVFNAVYTDFTIIAFSNGIGASVNLRVTYREKVVTPPTVSITSPANNTIIAEGTNLTIDATAADTDGSISKVEFYVGSTKMGEDATSPYSFTWNNIAYGNFSFTAKAIDNDGASTISSAVNVEVNALPSVSISSPSNNTVLATGSNLTIDVLATDNNGSISKVEFYNGGTGIGEDLTYPYSLPLTNLVNGTYVFAAKAYDNLGYANTSAIVTVVVTAFPTVSITAPSNGTTTSPAPASITITATAADSDGGISKVEFYQGTTKIGEDDTTPYSFDWTNISAGSYALTAKAIDNAGAVTPSSVVNITVPQGGCSAPQYIENGGYIAGSRVKNNGTQYECKGYPFTSWCNGAAWAYAPGTGAYWTDAWTQIGACRSGAFEMDASSVVLYPNPASNTVSINFASENSGALTITVINEFSETVKTETMAAHTGDNLVEVNLNDLTSGIYMLKIENNGRIFTKKLSVIK